MRSKLYLFVLFITLGFSMGCQQTTKDSGSKKTIIRGKTMGTTYSITYYAPPNDKNQLSMQIDYLLENINIGVSTYIPSSAIRLFNEAEVTYCLEKIDEQNIHFIKNLKASMKIAKATNNAFDPTIMPLVNYWGFGYTAKKKIEDVDSALVKEKMACVGMEKVHIDSTRKMCFTKDLPCTQLDFSAIAKGYAVDQISDLLTHFGYKNHLVEIGGEMVAKGHKDDNSPWVAGISTPEENSPVNHIEHKVSLENKALATSGNYRNFYKTNGHTYSHTINTKTGYPERSNLLSVTVAAQNCMTADAYATSFMSMGYDKAMAFATAAPNIEALFIFLDKDKKMKTTKTEGFKGLID